MSNINKMRRLRRAKRKIHIRKALFGTADRPRLSVYRSHKNIYAQLVNDDEANTMLSTNGKVSTIVEGPEGVSGKCLVAYSVGRAIADQAKEKGIAKMVFDRNGYLYHGRIAALARGLRDGGIEV